MQVQHKPLETMFMHLDLSIQDQVDPDKPLNRPDYNTDGQPSVCNQILESLPIREGTFHETYLVTAHGSGSKWIGALEFRVTMLLMKVNNICKLHSILLFNFVNDAQ